MSSSTLLSLYPSNSLQLGGSPATNQRFLSSVSPIQPNNGRKPFPCSALKTQEAMASALVATGLVSALVVGTASAATELPFLGAEPSNALSLPTWAVHVSSVAEWITAMALVWRYGDRPGLEAWKGLSWGMVSLATFILLLLYVELNRKKLMQVPLLGGAMCACTWHFFYNAESLEVVVALQAALTVIGNATMCFAAYRIYKAQEHSGTS